MRQSTINHVQSMNQGLWVLLWSKQQNAFHVEPLDSMLKTNREAYSENRPGDYRVLHIGYREDVSDVADSCRGTLKAREQSSVDIFRKAI